jgi:hypothetical protein
MPSAVLIHNLLQAPVKAKQWGYVLPFKLQKRFFATGRISRHENLALNSQGLLIKYTKQSIHGTGRTSRVAQTNININLSHLRRKQKHLALGTAYAFSKSVWHAEAKTVRPQRSVWAIQARTLRSQQVAAKIEGKKAYGLILEALELLEEQRFYLYIALMDACSDCLRYDGRIMTRREIDAIFKFLIKLDDNIWLPTVHPNCRCLLILWEIEL